jgi:hypothetical protein
MDCTPTLGRSSVGRNRRGRRQPASCSFGFSRAELPCASAGDKAGWRAGSPVRRSSRWGRLAPAVNSVGKSAMTSGGALVLQVTGAGRVKGIRWGWPRNCRLNDKTERNRWDERDGVLTFGQGWTIATEELAGVGEELAGVGEDDGGDVGFAWLSTSQCRARRGKLQGGVHLHRKCTVSPEKLAGSSPEFSRCKSSARVCGS